MGASARPEPNENPFKQPAGLALEPQQRRYSPENPFASPDETYSPDNPFAPSTIRHAPVVVTPPEHEPVVVEPDVGSSANPLRMPPAVVSDTAPSPRAPAAPAQPLRMPPAVVNAPPSAINARPPLAPGVPAIEPDASRVGPPPGSEGTPLAKADFATRVAGALLGPVVDPLGAVKGMAQQVGTANRAAAENDAAAAIGMTGQDPNLVERTVSPVEAKNAAITTATLLAAPLAAEAEALLGSRLAPAIGSRLAGAVARTTVPGAIGAGLMPQDPLVGAAAGAAGGAVHEAVSPLRPTVQGWITREPSAMLPETTTPRAPTATGRILSPDNPFAPTEPDYTVETNPAPAAPPAQPAPAPAAAPEPAPAEASPVPEPVETAKPARTGDVIFEDGEKRFVDARTRAGGRRAPEKVSTDGLVAELNDVMQRRDDAARRAQYENRLDENGHTKAVGDYVQVATRLGKGGPTEQAKALTNLDDANRIIDELTAELKRRGLSDDDIYERLSAHGDMSEERAGLAEDYNAGRINSEVVRDEQGNVLFSPRRQPTVSKPTGETDLFGQHVTEEVPAQTSMFGENAGTKLAQDDAAKLAKHNEAIDADEMARRRDELGAERQNIPGAEEPDQGLLFDRAGTAPTEQGELPLDEPVDFGARQQPNAAPNAKPQPKGGGITFTLRQISQRLAKALTVPIRERYFPFARFKARGVYKTQPQVARVMDLQDLDVAAHEAGHHVANLHLGGLDDARTQQILANHPGVESDLRRLGVDLYGPKAKNLHLQEGIAELFKWYVMDPAHLKQRAPNALRWLENDVFPKEGEIAKAFTQARGDFELFQKSPVDQKLAALYAKQSPERSIADIRDAVGRFLRAKFTDDLAEFERLKKDGAIPERAQDDPYLLAMASRTDGAWVQNALNYGIPNATGRRITVSYKKLLDRIPKGEATRYKNYLIAERLNEQASHTQTLITPNGAQRVSDILTEAPQRLNHPGVVRSLDAVVGRLTGHLETNPKGGTGGTVKAGLTYDDVRKVVEDGRKDAKLAAWAEDFWQFNHAIVGLLKDHLLTPSEVFRIVDANRKYVSFHRIFDEELGSRLGGTGKAYPRNAPGLGRLKGSSRSIEDPLESPVLALYKAARMVHKHAAFEALVKLTTHRDVEGMGYLVEQVHTPVDAIKLTVTKEVVDQLEAAGLDRQDAEALEGAKLIQYVARTFATAKNTRDMVLPALVKGKRRWFKIGDKRLWDAVQSMGAEEVPEWLRWLEIPARALRAGTTLVPGFSVGTNWWRDAFDAATYSKAKTRPPFYHFIRGLFHMAKQDAIFHMFELEGGDVGAQMLYDRQHLGEKLRDLSKNKALAGSTTVVRSPADYARALSTLSRKYLFESWLHPLEKLASIPERATRIGETGLVYDQLLREAEAKAKASGQPVTDQDRIDIRKRAAAAGREVTLNFVRGGTWVRQLNRMSVFLKPSVESAARFGRETRSRPFTILARMAAWIGIPATIAYLAQRKDKDFQATPSWMRNTGFVFIEHNADGSFKHRWYFPAPNLEWWLWGVVPQRVMQWIDTKNPKALDEIGTSLVENVKPSLTPTFAVPIIENDRNRSYFGDRPIEPSGLEELEPGYRATPETGETARLIGKETNTSPAKFENLVRGYTGGLGTAALRASDKAVHAVKGALGKPEEVNSIRDIDPLHNAPVLGRFERGQGNAMSSAWVQQFYDTWIKNNEYRSTLLALRKAGRDDEADRYLDEHQAAIATVATAEDLHPHDRGAKPGPFREAHDALTQLRQKMDALSHENLSPEEYRAQVSEVNEQMLMVARRALEAAGVKVMPAGSPEP